MDNVLSVLTFKSVDTILRVGGTQSWALDRVRAKNCKYAVVCRNANRADVEGPEAHGSAFMIGMIKDVVPSTETEGRWLVLFSHYALCNVGEQWEGRNPVRFWTTADYDKIDFNDQEWELMPEVEKVAEEPRGLTIAEAKAGLAHTLGISPSAIEIIIRS